MIFFIKINYDKKMTDISELYIFQYLKVICPYKLLKTKQGAKELVEVSRFIYPPLNYSNINLRLLIIYGSHTIPLYIFRSILPKECSTNQYQEDDDRNISHENKINDKKQIHHISLVYSDPFYEHNEIKTISRSYINLILQWNNRYILNYCMRFRKRLQDSKFMTLLYVDKIIDKYQYHPNGCDFCKYDCCINPQSRENKYHDSYEELGYLPDLHEKILMIDPEILDPRFSRIYFNNIYMYAYGYKYDEDYQLIKFNRKLKEYNY